MPCNHSHFTMQILWVSSLRECRRLDVQLQNKTKLGSVALKCNLLKNTVLLIWILVRLPVNEERFHGYVGNLENPQLPHLITNV